MLPLCFSFDPWASPGAMTAQELGATVATNTPTKTPSPKAEPSYAYPNTLLGSYAFPLGVSATFLVIAPPLVLFTFPATLLAPPIVHAAYGHPGWAFGSLIALTLFSVAGASTALAFDPECENDSRTRDQAHGICVPRGVVAGALVGEAVWAVMDVTTAYWHVEPPSASAGSPRVYPTFALAPGHGLFAGLAVDFD